MTSQAAKNHDLIDALHKLSKKSPKLVRSSKYTAPADPSVTIWSWKMNEFKYYEVPSPFPTLARGLFTREEDQGNDPRDKQYSIVARGYDKFFNIGEVPWTTWKALETHTTAPYHLTLKSNGCIIFIAPLNDTKLLITSKHSLGPIQGQTTSHALEGEAWLRKHLQASGKTEEQLAKTLWHNGWTVVAELCDDNFEEHVLPYSEEMTGLHLHGINNTAGAFETRDPAEVTAFAREWGFIPTLHTTLDTVQKVREFTQEVSKSGKWNGHPIEGFVVRTRISSKPSPPGETTDASTISVQKEIPENRPSGKDTPPYPPGSSFFFKVKFDEPYMMYRDWREITKALLSKNNGEVRISKSKLNRPETRLYMEWVQQEIKNNRKAFDGYTNNKGIIATRERFLRWCETEGKDKLAQHSAQKPGTPVREHKGETPCKSKQSEVDSQGAGMMEDSQRMELDGRPRKTVIVPVAVPGCGKTSIAVALAHLFGFGHTQSDDIKARKPAPVFLQNVVNLLQKHQVVIADKNNHMAQHRRALRIATVNMIPPPRLIALNWSLERPPAIIHRICGDRIQARGENHQTLRPDDRRAHEDVLWMFMDQAEELSENEVDDIIEMDVAESLEDGLARAVDGLVRLLGLERPTDEQMGEAVRVAMTYTPKGKPQDRQRKEMEAMQGKENPAKKHAPGRPPRYYGILPELDLETVVSTRFAESDITEDAKAFWKHLKEANRVTTHPHITLVHSKNRPTEEAMWQRCMSIHQLVSQPSFSFKLGSIVYDERVMAIPVDDLAVSTQDDGADVDAAQRFVEAMPDDVRKRLHITIGTRTKDINPVEAKDLVGSWRDGAKVSSYPLENIQTKGRIKGLYF